MYKQSQARLGVDNVRAEGPMEQGMDYVSKNAQLATLEEAVEALRRVEAELEALLAERSSMQDEFHERVRNFAHDIKSALGGVVGYSQLLKNDSLDAEKSLKYADAIHRSALKVVDICDAMVEREMDLANAGRPASGNY